MANWGNNTILINGPVDTIRKLTAALDDGTAFVQVYADLERAKDKPYYLFLESRELAETKTFSEADSNLQPGSSLALSIWARTRNGAPIFEIKALSAEYPDLKFELRTIWNPGEGDDQRLRYQAGEFVWWQCPGGREYLGIVGPGCTVYHTLTGCKPEAPDVDADGDPQIHDIAGFAWLWRSKHHYRWCVGQIPGWLRALEPGERESESGTFLESNVLVNRDQEFFELLGGEKGGRNYDDEYGEDGYYSYEGPYADLDETDFSYWERTVRTMHGRKPEVQARRRAEYEQREREFRLAESAEMLADAYSGKSHDDDDFPF